MLGWGEDREESSFSEEKEAKRLLVLVQLKPGAWISFWVRQREDKSLFASFSSEKEDSFFILNCLAVAR
jgi:hypothetical protein